MSAELKIAVDSMKCIPCGVCVLICPKDALMINERGVEQIKGCNGCELCVKYCPLVAIEVKKE